MYLHREARLVHTTMLAGCCKEIVIASFLQSVHLLIVPHARLSGCQRVPAHANPISSTGISINLITVRVIQKNPLHRVGSQFDPPSKYALTRYLVPVDAIVLARAFG